MFPRRRGGYLVLVLLIGILGGIAMGAIAAARRTQSSFSTYLTSTNPSNLSLGTALLNPALGYDSGIDPSLVRRISHLPLVKQVRSYDEVYGTQLTNAGTPLNGNANVDGLGSVDGEYFTQDKVTVVRGRMADPRKADEVVMSAAAARMLDWRVGQVYPFGFYSDAQVLNTPNNAPPPRPYVHLEMKLVGLVAFSNTVVQDQIDTTGAQPLLFTPALTRQVGGCCSNFSFAYLQLEHGDADVAKVETEIQRIFPPTLPFDPNAASTISTKADRAIKPEAIALGVFGGLAALAALLIATQVIGRQLRVDAQEHSTMRALGASPAATMADGVVGIVGAILLGSLLALAVAIGLSPLSPLGPVRSVYPSSGIAFDWTVLGLGLLVLFVGLSGLAVLLAYRQAPHRAGVGTLAKERGLGLAHAAAATGTPVSAQAGIRFALEPGSGHNAVPVRSAIFGATLAVIVVIGTITFGSSLNYLVSQPRLYGWNWDYALSGGGGVGDIPQQQSAALLDHDPYVASWTGAYFGNLRIDGHTVPVLGESPRARVQPPLLSGHALEGPDEIVLGAITLAQLHEHLGGSVSVQYEYSKPTNLRIVGTATMPAIGITGVDISHMSMGIGAVLPYQLIPAAVRDSFGNTPAGPNIIFVQFRHGSSSTAAVHSLREMTGPLNLPTNYGVSVLPVQRPAEIVNYRSMGTTPAILGAGLAAGAVCALGLTLVASVRRRQRDLALLKTLGFTRRQLAATVAWQATVAVAIGTVVGVPIGIALGRILWEMFAHEIDAVPTPDVPVLTIALVAIGGLVLANLVSALPGRIAARTRTAVLLRAE